MGGRNSASMSPAQVCSAIHNPKPAFRVQGVGFRVQDSGFRVQGLRFGVEGLGFRV